MIQNLYEYEGNASVAELLTQTEPTMPSERDTADGMFALELGDPLLPFPHFPDVVRNPSVQTASASLFLDKRGLVQCSKSSGHWVFFFHL